MKHFLLFIFFVFTVALQAQTLITMPTNSDAGPTKSVGCGDAIFTDSGNTTGNYVNNENGALIFCPVIETDRMVLDFSSMAISAGDVMTIYDGDSTSAPVLSTFTNTMTAPGAIQASATNSTGCLTITFVSNTSGVAAGWEARRRCFDPCQTITTDITTTPAIDPDGILRICQGDIVQFDGSATFSNSGAGATYAWDFDTGRGFNTGQSQTETFTDAGSYQVRFKVTDANGCTDRELIDLIVQVSNDPDFTGTMVDQDTICLGETALLTGAASSVEFVATPAPPVTGTTFLPDGNGVSYQTCIDVKTFEPGAVFTNASNLISTFINIEHSWANDLDIILTAPNGTSIEILRFMQNGSERYLGIPVDDTTTVPGEGFEYVIREDAPATQTFQNAVRNSQARTLPAGSYFPTTSFSNFIGSNLNGRWCLTVTDNLRDDNGYIFEWGLNFDPALIPADLSFEPNEVSEGWRPDPTIRATNGNEITVQPTAVGTKCYYYEYEDSFGCAYVKEVCIEVNAVPAPNVPDDLLVCDNMGTITTVDLTQNTTTMLAGQNAASFNVAYYQQLTDAQGLINPIANPSQYAAQTTAQTIYTSVTNADTGCSLILDFQVSINRATYTDPPDVLVCDDPSNDGFAVFDLAAQTPQILGTQSSSEVSVSYYRSQAEANAATNPIANSAAYTNQNSPQQTIHVRVENNTDTSCFDLGSFELVIGGNPVANPISDLAICDDASNDGIANFVLGTRDVEILGGQNSSDYEVTYYRNPQDANDRQNAVSKTAFPNTSNPQTLVARIDSRLNSACYQTTSFDLIVQQKPVLGTPAALTTCDDPSGDGVEDFDLSLNDTAILNGLPAADYQITYYLSQNNADTAAAPVSSPYSSSVATDAIFVRVEHLGTGCFSTVSFPININPVPQIAAVQSLLACDDNNDSISVFRLNDRLNAIQNGQTGVSVSYYNSQADALSGASPLNAESYQSTTQTETIFYRSQFDATACYTTGSFEIETVAPPVAAPPAAVELCDSGDGTITYDLSNSSTQIQNGQTNTVVTYFNSQTNANSASSPLSNTQTFTNDTTVYARLENSNTGCFDTIALEIRFGGLPEPSLQEEVVLCRDAQGVLVDGPAVLDTGLNSMDFDFEWRRDDQLLPDETSSTLTTDQPGSYEVTVINKASRCQNTDTTLVRFAGPPDTFDIEVTTQPFNEDHRIEVDVTGPDTYWFQLDDGLYQDSNVFENVSPGNHSITIAERNGCGSLTTQVFVFGYPKVFTPNNDGYNDTWNVAAGDRLPILNIYIFDRYGKLLHQLSPTGTGWDGTFQGNPLPSTDYWFKLDYEFEGTMREATGHFAMKR